MTGPLRTRDIVLASCSLLALAVCLEFHESAQATAIGIVEAENDRSVVLDAVQGTLASTVHHLEHVIDTLSGTGTAPCSPYHPRSSVVGDVRTFRLAEPPDATFENRPDEIPPYVQNIAEHARTTRTRQKGLATSGQEILLSIARPLGPGCVLTATAPVTRGLEDVATRLGGVAAVVRDAKVIAWVGDMSDPDLIATVMRSNEDKLYLIRDRVFSIVTAQASQDGGDSSRVVLGWDAAPGKNATSLRVILGILGLVVAGAIFSAVAAGATRGRAPMFRGKVGLLGRWLLGRDLRRVEAAIRDRLAGLAEHLDEDRRSEFLGELERAGKRAGARDLTDALDPLGPLVRRLSQDLADQKRIREAAEAEIVGLREARVSEAAFRDERMDVFATLGHEFRTPLAVIDAHAQKVLRRADHLGSDELVRRMQAVRSVVKRLEELINRLLNQASLETGLPGTVSRSVRIDLLVEDCCLRIAETHPEHDLRFDLSGACAEIEGDPLFLDHVFSNLLSNAAKYAKAGQERPTIEVTGGVDADGCVRILVRDEGIGIGSADLPRIFTKFFRAGTASDIPGTGLGLYHVRRIVEAHGGRVEVSSEEGVGTRFEVILPPRKDPGRPGTEQGPGA